MTTDDNKRTLQKIAVSKIDRNPDNPRIIFRQAELDELMDSIQQYGVQVPISVYREAGRFVLIDGERRWRCCRKLNKDTIPALVQSKPTPLNNLLLMFNIHSLREQWDLLTTAHRLPKLIDLIEEDLGRKPKEREISEQTGLSIAVIRRCKLLINLPEHYLDELLDELRKPKSQQKLSEDFFIEMERSLTTVENRLPGVIEDRDSVRRVLIDKYKTKTIDSLIHLRMLAKIARAKNVEADDGLARAALKKAFKRNDYSIEAAYEDSVAAAYVERDLLSRINQIIKALEGFSDKDADADIQEALQELHAKLGEILGGGA